MRNLQRHIATFRRRLQALDMPVTAASGRHGLGSVDLHFDEIHHPGVAFLTLNQPAKRNAVTAAMMLDLAGHVTELDERCRASGSDAVRAVLLRGAGSHFCAGADFSLAQMLRTTEQGLEMFDLMASTLDGLYDLPCITVAAVEGHAKGGGAEMLTACDFRVFAESADVQYVHSRMGISPGWGGASRLRDIIGRGRALRLLAMGTPLKGGTAALEYGLADFVVKDEKNVEEEEWLGVPSAGAQRRGDSADAGDGRDSSNHQYSSVDLGALAFLDPVLKVESVAALRAIKRAVSGGRMGDGAPGGGGRNDDERQAFAGVWGAEDNLRAVDAAVARLSRR